MDPSALGRYLRESREAKELTLENAVSALRIRRPILEAFERGEFESIESPVQMRGMLRNYARYLSLDEERVLQYYETAQDGQRRRKRGKRRTEDETHPTAPRHITDTPPTLPTVRIEKRRANGGMNIITVLRAIMMILVSIAAVLVIGFVVYDTLFKEDDGLAIADAATLPVASATPTATYTASWTPPPSNTPMPVGFNQGITGLAVDIEITQRTWLQIIIDGTETFTGIMQPGERHLYEGTSAIQVNSSNAAALSVIFNGEPQAPFGERGQQVQLDFTQAGIGLTRIQGEASPTPVLVAIPTETSIPIEAASPTPTGQQAALEPSPTALFADNSVSTQVSSAQGQLPTPTPLFGGGNNNTSSGDPDLATQNQVAQAANPTQQSQAVFATNTNAPTNTPRPTSTPTPRPTSNVVLPARSTPLNPTATKTAP